MCVRMGQRTNKSKSVVWDIVYLVCCAGWEHSAMPSLSSQTCPAVSWSVPACWPWSRCARWPRALSPCRLGNDGCEGVKEVVVVSCRGACRPFASACVSMFGCVLLPLNARLTKRGSRSGGGPACNKHETPMGHSRKSLTSECTSGPAWGALGTCPTSMHAIATVSNKA